MSVLNPQPWSLVLICLQGLIGMVIVIGGFVVLCMGTDRHTSWLIKGPVIGLVGWGCWFGALPLEGRHDSLAAIALAALVAYVLIAHGRQVRGILIGESWWFDLGAISQGKPVQTIEDKSEVHP